MSETTLRIKTQADIAALREYTAAVRDYASAVRDASVAAWARPSDSGGPPAPGGGSPAPGGATAPGGGGAAPPQPPPPPAAPPGAPTTPGGAYGAPGPYSAVSDGPGAASMGAGYLRSLGATAVGIGLGASLTGFLLSSGQKYLELSKVIAHTNARFREGEEAVISYGHAMGYTLGETAGLLEALGSVRDGISRPEFLRLTGFARTMGVDPSQSLSIMGRLGTLGGGAVTDKNLAELAGRASRSGMGQGRFGEVLDVLRSLAEGQFGATGGFDWRSTMGLQGLGAAVFGDADPRGQGREGMGLVQGLNATLTGGQSSTYMMRAMGYGSEGGPDYITMRKRMDAGVYDPRNVADLFGSFRARGMGRGAMFRALEVASGGSLKAWQIEALVDSLGTDEGMARFQGDVSGAGVEDYIGQVTGGGAPNFTASGRRRISMGEGRAVQMEGMQMAVGDTVAQAMVDLTTVMQNLARTGANLLGNDLGSVLTAFTGALVRATGAMDRMTQPGASFRQSVIEAPSRFFDDATAGDALKRASQYSGPGWGIVQGSLWASGYYDDEGGGR